MQINIAGHHVEITDGIRESVNSKFKKIATHYPSLDSISVTLTVERNEQKVEVHSLFKGSPIAVNASNGDLYAAIADAARKLNASLETRKGASAAQRHNRPVVD